MLRCFILFLFFTSISAFSQKVTIDHSLKVAESNLNFNITYKYKDEKNKVQSFKEIFKFNKHSDYIKHDTLNIYISQTSTSVIALKISIVHNKIIPVLYEWSDAGGIVTITPFTSYYLSLNSDNYQFGDILYGKFKGRALKKPSEDETTEYEVEGKFAHVIENTADKMEQLFRRPSEYLQTGIYKISDTINVRRQLKNTQTEYQIIPRPLVFIFSFESCKSNYDEKTKSLRFYFKIRKNGLDFWKEYVRENSGPVAFVFRNELYSVMEQLNIYNNCFVVTIPANNKEDAELYTKQIKILIDQNKKL